MTATTYKEAHPYGDSALALPVADLDAASTWYAHAFGLTEVDREASPTPRVIMERDDVRLGFALNGADPSQEGAAILVSDIHAARDELEGRGIQTANWRVDERDGRRYQVFFVVAPDGLCYSFHQPLD